MDFVDDATGEVFGPEGLAQRHPNVSFAWPPTAESLAPFGIALLHATPAPRPGPYQRVRRDGAVKQKGRWVIRWAVEDVTDPDERARIERDHALSCRLWVEGMTAQRLNDEAKARGYDSIHAAALRAAYPGPYRAEGIALATWMDACWAAAYALLPTLAIGMDHADVAAALDAKLPPAPPAS